MEVIINMFEDVNWGDSIITGIVAGVIIFGIDKLFWKIFGGIRIKAVRADD